MIVRELASRANYLLKERGLPALLKQGLVYFSSFLFKYEAFCIHLHYPPGIREFAEEDFVPKIEHCRFFIVQTNAEADKLESLGFVFRSHIFRSREALASGGIAFLVFCDKEIASITWVSLNPDAQKILCEPPKKVDFANGESITSAAQTLPEFRNKGLFAYTMFKSREFLAQKGIVRDWGLTSRNNRASEFTVKKFHPQFMGYGHWWRIFGFSFYWEKKQNADS